MTHHYAQETISAVTLHSANVTFADALRLLMSLYIGKTILRKNFT